MAYPEAGFLVQVFPVRGVPVVDGLKAVWLRDRAVGRVRATSTTSLASSGPAAPQRCLRRVPVANVR